MRLAATEHLVVAPRGSGSALDLGMPPLALDIAMDLCRLDGIVDYVPADMVATVQAGARLDTLARELGKHGQMLALDPYGGSSRTVGGVLATGASGPRRFRYGSGRDLLLGARFVQADGTITWGGSKVVKSVTGYDIPKLLAGSLGTLGIIVEATLRLHPAPAALGSWLFAFGSREAAASFVAALLASTLEPERLTSLNGAALARAGHPGAEAGVAVQVSHGQARRSVRNGRMLSCPSLQATPSAYRPTSDSFSIAAATTATLPDDGALDKRVGRSIRAND